MEPLKTAILGCGSFSHRHAQNLLSLGSQVELVAFCDRHEDRAGAYNEKYAQGKAAIYNHHAELLAREQLDLLIICLPPYSHGDEVQRAAERGVHLLLEKPIALSSEHAWRMVAAVESAGVKTQVGFMFRFGEAVEQVKRLIGSGEAGQPGLMTARYFCNSLHAPWWRVREKSGGQLVEQVIHMVDLMRYLMGEPVSIFSRQENLFHRQVPDYSIEDTSASVVSFQNGAIGVIYASNGAIPNRWINDYRIVTQRTTTEFASANNATIHFTDEIDRPPLVIASERNIYLAELQDLIQAVRTGGDTRTPIREGARSLDLALAATRSAQARQEIILKPPLG